MKQEITAGACPSHHRFCGAPHTARQKASRLKTYLEKDPEARSGVLGLGALGRGVLVGLVEGSVGAREGNLFERIGVRIDS
jgi:hypothetical protein